MNRFRSFKLKLVAYFLLLSLLPLAAAYWGFAAVAERSVTASVDARLEAGVRAAVAAYEDELRRAEAAAQRVARDRTFQRALVRRDRGGVERMLAGEPSVRLEAPWLEAGADPPLAAETRVVLTGPQLRDTAVVGVLPIDAALARRLRARSGLRTDDAIALVHDGAVVAAGGPIRGRVDSLPGRFDTMEIGDERYRGVAVRLVPDAGVSLAAVTPESSVAAERRSVAERLLLALAGALALIGVVAYLAGRAIARALGRLSEAAHEIAAGRLDERVPVRGQDEIAQLGHAFNDMAEQLEQRLADLEAERERLRDANIRFGEALAATLDAEQLLRVIVETAVEATGASGGLLVGERGETVSAGDPGKGRVRLDFPLTAGRASFGTLMLSGDSFTDDDRMTAASLAGQAVVALENVRLHRIIERQALVDGLTGLANRRHADETLATELARADRFDGRFGLILADIDDFKRINDVHGHPTGDAVLREFAQTLRECVREIDLAARWGGEEFCVLLPAADIDGAVRTAERIRLAFAERSIVAADGTELGATASFGVAAFPAHGTQADLVGAADRALYRAKRDGKNRVVAAEPSAYHV